VHSATSNNHAAANKVLVKRRDDRLEGRVTPKAKAIDARAKVVGKSVVAAVIVCRDDYSMVYRGSALVPVSMLKD